MIFRGDFLELTQKAISDPTQENLKNLWQWCISFGETLWNGECFDVSLPGEPTGCRELRPTWFWDDQRQRYSFRDYELR